MFILITKESAQVLKHSGRCAIAEPELFSYRKAKYEVQSEQNGHKTANDNYNHHDEIELSNAISKKNT